MEEQPFYWIYMLECENGSHYTGYTTQLQERYQAHLNKTARCKYTSSFKPIKIAQRWYVPTKSEAMKVESFIKNQRSTLKKEFVLKPFLLKETVENLLGIIINY